MGIFSVHRRIVEDYASYIRSFATIADEVMANLVRGITEKNKGHLDTGMLGTKFLPMDSSAAVYPVGSGTHRFDSSLTDTVN